MVQQVVEVAIKRKYGRLGVWLMAVLFAGTLPASGRVFQLFGGNGGSDGKDAFHNDSLPWSKAYITKMNVNGRPAKMRLYSARYSEPVVNQLVARFKEMGAEVKVSRTEGGATGRAVFSDRTVSFIVLSPPKEPTQQIFLYEPTGEEGKVAKFPVPKYNRATVRTTISDDQVGTWLATFDTASSATETHVFYAEAMTAAGWKMVAPALIKDGTVTGMAVYERKSQVCYVQATDRVGGANMITLLVKGGAL